MVLINSQLEVCKKLLVVDVDPGIDDAFALLILLAAHKINLICLAAVLCSVGNVKRGQSCENLAVITSLLNAYNPTFPITYFEGSSNYMIKQEEFSDYYGKDGLGDVTERPIVNTDDFRKYYEFQDFMHKLTEEFPKKVSFMSLAPLTVAATLLLQQPTLNLKDIWIMGGNDIGREDFAEWNFYCDSHAANITISHSRVPIYVTTFQACEDVEASMSWRNYTLGTLNITFIDFMNKAESNFYGEHIPDIWAMYDPVVAAAFVNNGMIMKKEVHNVQVYLGDKKEQGLLVSGSTNVTFIKKINNELYKKTLQGATEVFL